MISDFEVPEAARVALQNPQGPLVSETDIKGFIPENIIAVGDEIVLKLLGLGITPLISVFDHKTQRKELDEGKKAKLGNPDITAKNPAGTISLEAWNALKQLIGTGGRLFIDGEDDLLALSAFFLAPTGHKILYGQPDEGIVCMEVTDEQKQHYAELLIVAKASEFLSKISGKTVALHHNDADGMCSAIPFVKKTSAVPIVTNDVTIHSNLIREIEKEEPDNLIIVDLGGEARRDIEALSKKMSVMVLDHHKICADKPFGNAVFLNPHMFEIPEQRIAPASYLSYLSAQGEDWVAAIGVIGDKGFVPCEEFLKSVRAKYNVDFDHITELVNAADAVGESDTAVQIILEAKGPEELLKSKRLNEYYETVHSEIEALLSGHEDRADLLANGIVLLYEISSELEMRGAVANKLQAKYPDKVIIIGEVEDDDFSMSLRTMRNDIDMVPLIKSSIQGLGESSGGGHAKAAGCKVRLGDKETFLERFLKLMDSRI